MEWKNISRIKWLILIIVVYIGISQGCRKSDYLLDESTINLSDNGEGTGTVTWTADKTYHLSGFVFVNDGQTLTIEPGTVVKFKSGQGSQASALVVARGGKIIANGTADKPIIFTSEFDEMNGNLNFMDRGLWGGLILLGNATLNTFDGEAHIEGIPVSEPRGTYGGIDDSHNAGSISYLSIRYAGSILSQGNEINGLTVGGIGRGTSIHHVEIIGCADDGVEIFGGTVDLKHIAIAFCDDDALDTELGYRGRIQYLLAIQDSLRGDYIAEHSGGANPILGSPNAQPIIANATFVGAGCNANNFLIGFKNNSAGKYFNSLFLNQKHGVSIEYIENSADSYNQWLDGDLELAGNYFFQVGTDTCTTVMSVSGDYPGTAAVDNWHNYFYTAPNYFIDPGIEISAGFIDLKPKNDVSQNLIIVADPFFDQVGYRGAFGSINWLEDWSLLSSSGFIL